MTRMTTFAAAFLALACFYSSPLKAQDAKDKHAHGEHGEHVEELPKLGVADVLPTRDNKTRGMLRLVQKGKDIHVHGKIRNLSPGEHGFHIHQFGDLRDMAAGTSAGGHFNPTGAEHGTLEHGHVGDLGNITADSEGVATVDVTLKDTKLHFILGRAFVVHADRDDLKSQPSGAAGPRVGLGVIGIGNPDYKMTPKAK